MCRSLASDGKQSGKDCNCAESNAEGFVDSVEQLEIHFF